MSSKRPADGRLDRLRAAWRHRGQARPGFAAIPGAGQESVWDYPRPPAIVADRRLIEVRAGDRLIARSDQSVRVLETASPPTFYLPREGVEMPELQPVGERSFCEWKGEACYFVLRTDDGRGQPVAWSYENPRAEFARIDGYISFYPGRVACFVAVERVRPQSGGFYGGWVTDEIVGPYKGEPGTTGW